MGESQALNEDSRQGDQQEARKDAETEVSIDLQDVLIVQRRAKILPLLAQSKSQEEMATILGVNQSTISRDIQAIKEEFKKSLQNLANSDLAFSFEQSVRGIEEVKRKLWDKVNSESTNLTEKEKLKALHLIIVAEMAKLRAVERGPILSKFHDLANKVSKLEEELSLGTEAL